jgi:hypothetical protein
MASTYTPKLNLAKPAHGDVDWHIPINENWDKIDTELDKALKISGTTIDADKNWNGKSITNVNQFQAASADLTAITTSRYTLVPDPCVCYADNSTIENQSYDEPVVKTAPPVPAGQSGTVTVHCNLKSSSSSKNAYVRINRNGVQVAYFATKSTSFELQSANVTVSPGDVLSLLLNAQANATATNSLFEIRAIPLPGIVNSFTW